jgi:hypothetical protein
MVDDLADIARRHGTDKVDTHAYTRHYARHLGHLRDRPIRLLEIGIGGYADPRAGGGSLRMWRDYFRQGMIVGLDLWDKRSHAEERIRIYQGSQADPAVLQRVIEECGPFDVVVDDGSHVCAHILASFAYLFARGLADEGIYAIEDLQTSYWPSFGGHDPPTAKTSMGLIRDLCDGLNYNERHRPNRQPTYTEQHVVGVHCYHNLAFIEKGRNDLPSNMIRDRHVPFEMRHPQVHWALGKARVATRLLFLGKMPHRWRKRSM